MSTDQERPKRPWGRMLVVVTALLVVASGCELAATWTPAGTDDSVPERPDRVSLSDVACPDTAACVAVGTQQTVPGSAFQLLVLRQVGSGWQRLDVPAGTSQLLRVGCRAVDDCVISATPADLHIGPGSVTTIPGTKPPDFYGERTIDCVAAGCVEVGADTSRSWDGSAWSADVPLPDDFPPIDRELACTAVDHCVLVATDVGIEVEIDTPARVQTAIWDGTGWSTPTTLDHETRTHGLDCATATTCFAGVGNRWSPFSTYGAPAELLAGDGTSWSPVPLTFPSGQPTEAPSVSCASATSCSALWAGGAGPEPGSSYVGLWDGSTWSVTPTSVAPTVSKLDCSAPATCVAAGGGAAQQLAGATATDLPLPTGTSPALDLNSLDCATPDACVGTGHVVLPGDEGFDEYTAALLRWDGTALRREPAIDSLSPAAACGGPDSCIVAGDRGGDQLVSKHWDGEQWVDLPPTSGFTGRVGTISCPTATWCLATAQLFSYPSSAPIAWEWSGGTTWSPLPRPSSLSGGGIMAGSCDARRSCVVATPDLGRVLRLDGTTWSEVDVGGLDLGAGPYLRDLSCPTKTFCALSGIRNRTTGTSNAFLAVLRDGTWERTDLSTGQVGAVDCWAASRCVATARQDSNLTWRLMAIGRNGWRKVEGPSGAMEPSDVSCPVARECVVSGAFVDGDQRRVLARVHIDG